MFLKVWNRTPFAGAGNWFCVKRTGLHVQEYWDGYTHRRSVGKGFAHRDDDEVIGVAVMVVEVVRMVMMTLCC